MSDKQLTELQQLFVDALFEEKGVVKKAAERAGINYGYAYQLIKGPLREAIIKQAEEIIALNAPRAAFTLADGVDGSSENPMSPLRLESAKQILDRVGIVKKEQIDINANVNTPLFILPAKDGSDTSTDS